jgi:hypothetical protein
MNEINFVLLLKMDVFPVLVVVYYVFGRVCGIPDRVRVNIGLSHFNVVGFGIGFGIFRSGVQIHHVWPSVVASGFCKKFITCFVHL